METKEFAIDTPNLKKSAPIPVALAALVAGLFAFDIYLGGVGGLILIAIWLWAGVIYTKNRLASEEKPSILNMLFNAAILAGFAALIHEIIFWIAYSIESNAIPYVSSIISSVLQAAIAGALASVVWYFYQTNKKA
jgi:hypothetical protein